MKQESIEYSTYFEYTIKHLRDLENSRNMKNTKTKPAVDGGGGGAMTVKKDNNIKSISTTTNNNKNDIADTDKITAVSPASSSSSSRF